MNASTPTSGAMTPDAARLGRLDRLLDTLGEHQLTIKSHGVSVTDISNRLKTVEARVPDLDGVLTLKEMDIPAQLAALQGAMDRMQRQAAARTREQDDARVQQELRLQALEQRQAATEAALRSLEDRIEEALCQQAGEAEELRQTMRGMMSQVVGRIADQFDALQSTLDEVMAARGQDREDQESRAAAQRAEVATLRGEVAEALQAQRDGAAAATAQVAERAAATEGVVLGHASRLAAVEEAVIGAEERQAQASASLQEAVTAWQGEVETKLGEAAAAFEQYKAYVGRLRREVRELHEESAATHAALVEALARELGGVGEGMALLQRDAAMLLNECATAQG